MARGIEGRDIFLTHADRDDFLERFGAIILQGPTQCYAWSLMSNHFHLLLQTGAMPIATLMRKLMTGYAVGFNRRHRRSGHLFQNRYKSILCDKDAYLLELVRYIHLNPLRAGIVKDLNALDKYKYGGHSVILGKKKREWQNEIDVLVLFSEGKNEARRRYHRFVEEGIDQGQKPELTGGGLLRSAGGWSGVRALRKTGVHFKSDERILGDSDFVDTVLNEAKEGMERKYALSAKGIGFDDLLHAVAEHLEILPEDILRPGKTRARVFARSLFCFWATRELGKTMTELAVQIGMTVAAVSISVSRGEKIVKEKKFDLKDILNL